MPSHGGEEEGLLMGSGEAVLSLPRNGVLLKEVKWIVKWWWLQRPGQEDEKRAGHGHGEAADLTLQELLFPIYNIISWLKPVAHCLFTFSC